MRRFLEETVGSDTEHTGEEEEEDYISFGVILLSMTLGILTRISIARWLPIPYTVLMLLWGCVFGAIYTELSNPFNEALDNSISSWLSMDPRMLQVIFFPILIFASAFNAQFHILERRLGQIIFLALPGVLLGATLTAVFIKMVLPYDWDWELCFVFGSMVAATDPVAVVALLEELGVSEKLGTLIEGESLLNDGSAIVVFEVFIEAIEGKERNWLEVIGFGARLALGGPAIGAVIGIAGSFFIGYVINDALVEVSLTLVLAYATFALCEDTSVKVSGVLALVSCGVLMSYYGKPRVSSSVLPSLTDFWKTLQFFADTLIFFLSGLIVVGVAVSDRAITAADFGYLLALFVALYVIRGIVVLFAYPVLRSGEYKITVPQMLVLTHSGLRGAVALMLALVVDGVHEIEVEQRDKIVFLTAGVAVLSLLVNGTTTGPLVRFLKLDRATEASESVFSNACFALELSMEKQQLMLQEDPFLSDADWSLVWRYIPIFTAESYWHRLSKGQIALSSEEVKDLFTHNNYVNDRRAGMLGRSQNWIRGKAGVCYRSLPHRLRSPWYAHHRKFSFEDAGGESVWGDLESFLTNHVTHGESSEAWSGHLKHTGIGGRSFWTAPTEDKAMSTAAAANGAEDATIDFDLKLGVDVSIDIDQSTESAKAGREQKERLGTHNEGKAADTPATTSGSEGARFNELPPTLPDGDGIDNKKKAQEAVEAPCALTGPPLQMRSNSSGAGDGEEEKKATEAPEDKSPFPNLGRKTMFQRATSMARAAGINLMFTEKDGDDGEIDRCAMEEARLRFLCALKAEYFRAKREGKLGSSGLRVLTEAMNYAHDRVEKGHELSVWSDLRDQFTSGWQTNVAKYMNWWPARPLMAAAIARRVSFQMEVAWNYLEAHHESNVKSILSNHGEISKVQRQLNHENQNEINRVEDTIAALTASAPMVTRSVKTRAAARVMIQRYREAAELLAENGHLDEKEEEVLMTAATEAEMWLAYHPNLEKLPPLPIVLEKIEFLAELTSEERDKVIESGAVKYQDYVGEVRLIEMGKLGSCGFKKGGEGDFCCWFFIVRGQIERHRMTEDGGIECGTHSSGMLFGITDAMLEIPHHAGYTTHGFSNLVVFDRAKLLELSQTIPTLDKSLWKSVAAHSLRRNIRFHKFKLQSCHRLIDKSSFLSGKTGSEAEEVIEMEAEDAIVLVRGRVIGVDDSILVTSLGEMDTSVAPVLLESVDQTEGGNVRVSGDYKVFRMASDTLMNFSRDETGRMSKRETRKRALSLTSISDLGGTRSVEDGSGMGRLGTGDACRDPLMAMMQREMTDNFNVRPRAASLGVKAAMKIMAGETAVEPGDEVGRGGDDVAGVEVGGVEEGEGLPLGSSWSKWQAMSVLSHWKGPKHGE